MFRCLGMVREGQGRHVWFSLDSDQNILLSVCALLYMELQQEGETKYFEQKQFAHKDHKFKRSTESVHVCVNTLEKIINEGGDPIQALKHLKFVSDKVAKGCFNFEVISGYDDAVRARVVLEGYGEFAKIETDEVFGNFSVENTVKKSDVSSKSQGKFKSGGGAKANGICFCYNSEEGCTGKCYFIYKCSECDSRQHGKKDCKKSK